MIVHFASQTPEWSTPQDFFDKLNAEFNFTLDVCATPGNAKCPAFYTETDNGLAQPWRGVCWMNPPYGRAIGGWVKKAYDETCNGVTTVALVPSRTDTRWWHDYIAKATEVRFVKGRLKFGGAKNNAPFPCAVVVFGSYCALV